MKKSYQNLLCDSKLKLTNFRASTQTRSWPLSVTNSPSAKNLYSSHLYFHSQSQNRLKCDLETTIVKCCFRINRIFKAGIGAPCSVVSGVRRPAVRRVRAIMRVSTCRTNYVPYRSGRTYPRSISSLVQAQPIDSNKKQKEYSITRDVPI